MKNKIQRWYQKDEYLNAFMNLLEQLPLDEQCEIAVDIIIETSSMTEREYSKTLNDIGDYNPKDFKRWYDKNPNLHAAIESLRDLSAKQREEVIKKYSDEILSELNIKIEGIDN